ncbi:MAG: tetratricopeptide repeat protein [Proteobacteria bacterium]|nr:tetratricopeptide repeat protein [Pseudomonadota bacterium]
MAEPSGFFAELKRRHVWRVAIAYAVTGWLLVQVATQVFPFFEIPNWAVRLVIALIVAGFPIAVIVAWVYELTPEGLRRTAPADSPAARPPHVNRRIARKLNTIIIALLATVVVVLSVRLLIVQRHVTAVAQVAPTSAPATTVAAARQAAPARSIAVLPFQNLSDEKGSEYFVAGMQDLILTKLAEIGDLKVISRASTQQYATRPANLKIVGEQLGVATILEGSVQRRGNQVLINVQLIDSHSDAHLWAQAYHRTLDDVFGVEGEVADKVAESLKATISPHESASLAAAPTRNRAAYDTYLRAEYLAVKGFANYDTASMKAAIPLYRQAIDQDPAFALAYARLSYAESQLGWFGRGDNDEKVLHANARSHAERALELAPELPAAYLAMGYTDYWGRGDYAAALKAFAKALVLRPNDAGALAAQGFVQRRQGDFEAAIASLEQAFALDPRNASLAFETGSAWMMISRYSDADRWLRRALEIDPHNRNAQVYLSNSVLLATGDIERALVAAQGDDPALKLQRVGLLMYQRKYADALALLDSVSDDPDNFSGATLGSISPKALQQAELHRLMGDARLARKLYAQALPAIREQLAQHQGINQAFSWQNLATAELRLGHTQQALDATARVQAIVDASHDFAYGPGLLQQNAMLYADANRPDLAVPQLAKALEVRGIGMFYSPVMLWLDPAWDPIRKDPRFQALLGKYAQHKPAVSYAVVPTVSTPVAVP